MALWLGMDSPWTYKKIACLLSLTLWGVRLTANFVARGGIGHEDWRYSAIRKDLGKHFWWASLFTVFIGQSLFLFAACLAIFPAMRAEGPLFLHLGVGLMICGVIVEYSSDKAMDAHLQGPMAMKVCRNGLWSLSRHPNYYGEFMVWLGLHLAFGDIVSSIGPIVVYALFRFISIDLMETRQLKRRRVDYSNYIIEVPIFFPLSYG